MSAVYDGCVRRDLRVTRDSGVAERCTTGSKVHHIQKHEPLGHQIRIMLKASTKKCMSRQGEGLRMSLIGRLRNQDLPCTVALRWLQTSIRITLLGFDKDHRFYDEMTCPIVYAVKARGVQPVTLVAVPRHDSRSRDEARDGRTSFPHAVASWCARCTHEVTISLLQLVPSWARLRRLLSKPEPPVPVVQRISMDRKLPCPSRWYLTAARAPAQRCWHVASLPAL
jgi:hypothetical protein